MKAMFKRCSMFMLISAFVLTLFSYSGNISVRAARTSWRFDDVSYSEDFQLLTDNKGNFYLVFPQKDTVCIKRINSNNNCLSVSLDKPKTYIGCAASDGIIYMLGSYRRNESYTEVSAYDFDSDYIEYVRLRDVAIDRREQLAVCGGKIYCINDKNRRSVLAYTASGEFLWKSKNNDDINIQLITNSEETEVFAVTANWLHRLNNGKFTYAASHNLRAPLFVCEDDYVCDMKGSFFNLYTGNSYNTDISGDNPYGAVINTYFIRGQGNQIYGKSIKTAGLSPMYTTAYSCTAVCCKNNKIGLYCKGDNSFTLLDKSELTYPRDNNASSASSNGTGSDNNGASRLDLSFYSNMYTIGGGYITGIKSGTTIARFKKNVHYGDFTLSFKNADGVNKKSGNVGSGYHLSCTYNSRQYYSYRLIVTGDVTGEGNVNSRDVRAVSGYLLGKSSLPEWGVMAADCNGDGKSDILDLLKIAKNNV